MPEVDENISAECVRRCNKNLGPLSVNDESVKIVTFFKSVFGMKGLTFLVIFCDLSLAVAEVGSLQIVSSQIHFCYTANNITLQKFLFDREPTLMIILVVDRQGGNGHGGGNILGTHISPTKHDRNMVDVKDPNAKRNNNKKKELTVSKWKRNLKRTRKV